MGESLLSAASDSHYTVNLRVARVAQDVSIHDMPGCGEVWPTLKSLGLRVRL